MPKAQPLTIDFTQPDALKQILPRSPILSSYEAGWEGINFAYYRQPAHEVPESYFAQHIISIHVGHSARMTVDGHFRNEYYANGDVGILPANQPSPLTWCNGEAEFINLYPCTFTTGLSLGSLTRTIFCTRPTLSPSQG